MARRYALLTNSFKLFSTLPYDIIYLPNECTSVALIANASRRIVRSVTVNVFPRVSSVFLTAASSLLGVSGFMKAALGLRADSEMTSEIL